MYFKQINQPWEEKQNRVFWSKEWVGESEKEREREGEREREKECKEKVNDIF